ncbi:hypothetical protein pb186bvf_006613 [Paramecium bursaria]
MDVINFQQKKGVLKKKKISNLFNQEQGENKLQSNTDLYLVALQRITSLLQENNPQLAQQTNIQLDKPIVDKLGSKKTQWKNFENICNQMNRKPNHVCLYVQLELGTEGTFIDKKLTLKGKFTGPNIESLIRKYLHEYVICGDCKSPNTKLEKEPESKLYKIECNQCKANKSVTSLKGKKNQ